MAISVGIKESYRERLIKSKEEIEQKNGKSLAELYEEKEKRMADAGQLKMPDRVPVTIQTTVFAAKYVGVPLSSMYYDHTSYRIASLLTALEFDADTGGVGAFANSGPSMELLDTKNAAWPGGTLPPDTPYQFVEGEYMKAEEYDLFLNDPSDFVLRYYLPRVYGLLAPLPKLPPFKDAIGGFGIQGLASIFASPEFRKIGEALVKIDEEQIRLRKEAAEFTNEMVELGFPPEYVGGGSTVMRGNTAGGSGVGVGGAPFDTISDFLRGMRGTMLDMYRCPDKLLAACDKLFEWRLAKAVPFTPDARGNPRRVFMALHRGSDGFMSVKDFEKFYWPTLKKAILTTIELGCIAAPFWEGIWDERLEYLLDFPKGKVIFHCENTDIFKAKEILGDHMCIQGGMPPTLLQVGSPQDIEDHCKKLIKVVGKNGGFILGPGSAMDYAKPENVRAMVETVKKYGWY
ncbi:MAG: uroporphyrinogen decarboxylase family protein [Dehalococcoidales bacterium]